MIDYMVVKLPSQEQKKAREEFKEKDDQDIRQLYQTYLLHIDYDTRHKQV